MNLLLHQEQIQKLVLKRINLKTNLRLIQKEIPRRLNPKRMRPRRLSLRKWSLQRKRILKRLSLRKLNQKKKSPRRRNLLELRPRKLKVLNYLNLKNHRQSKKNRQKKLCFKVVSTRKALPPHKWTKFKKPKNLPVKRTKTTRSWKLQTIY